MGVIATPHRRCLVLLGGSFDPVHNGHLAIAEYFFARLRPDELRIIPTGNSWQKNNLQVSATDRVAMLQCAFDVIKMPVAIDLQEIQRHTATYSIETLRAIRAEVGADASIAFVLGADQLQQLDTWKEWHSLFDYAHICVASRPGFSVDVLQMPQKLPQIPPAVAWEFTRRTGTPEQIRTTPHGLTYLASDLAVNVSSTEIRAALHRGSRPDTLVPRTVLDYIEQHHLYKN